MLKSGRTYSRSKSRYVEKKENPAVSDVFPATSKNDFSPFAMSESSESEKENEVCNTSNKRKVTRLDANKKRQKNEEKKEQCRKSNRNLSNMRSSLKSTPIAKRKSNMPSVSYRNKGKRENLCEGRKEQQMTEQESPPSIELPRKDLQVTWQEKISLLYPLMTNINAKASQVGKDLQKGAPTLNLSYEDIDEETEEEVETDDEEESEDIDESEKLGSSQYTTTYTYTWVTDDGTQTPTVNNHTNNSSKQQNLIALSPVPYIQEEVQLDEIEFEKDKTEVGKSPTEIVPQKIKDQTNEAMSFFEDTMGFKRTRKSEILNSTIINNAAQNIKQAQFPPDLSYIRSKDSDHFKVPIVFSSKMSTSLVGKKVLNSKDSELTEKKKSYKVLEKDNISDNKQTELTEKKKSYKVLEKGNISDNKQTELTVKKKSYKDLEKDNISDNKLTSHREHWKYDAKVNDKARKAAEILNSTEKNNAKCLQQIQWPEELSTIKPVENDDTNTQALLETTPKKVRKQPDISTPKKSKPTCTREKKYRKLLPKTSTLLFVSDRVELVDLIPEMSTITSGDKTSYTSSEPLHKRKKIQSTMQTVSSPFMLHVQSQKVDKQSQQYGNVLTSTPAKNKSQAPADGLDFDVSSVPQPSFDDNELVLQISREVNSLEIVSPPIDDEVNIYNPQEQNKSETVCKSLPQQDEHECISDVSATIVPETSKGNIKPVQSSDDSQKISDASQTIVPETSKDNVKSLQASDGTLTVAPEMSKGNIIFSCGIANSQAIVPVVREDKVDKPRVKVGSCDRRAKIPGKSTHSKKDVSTRISSKVGSCDRRVKIPGKSTHSKKDVSTRISSSFRNLVKDPVQVCPLTTLKRPWPKGRAVLKLKEHPKTVSVTDFVERYPEDVLLLLLDRRGLKKNRTLVKHQC